MVIVEFGTSSVNLLSGDELGLGFCVLVDGRCASRISSKCLKCVSGLVSIERAGQ